MKVLVCGAGGCVGAAVVGALFSRGHQVVQGARSLADGPQTLHVDFSTMVPPGQWARVLTALKVDAVVNCVGILMPSRGQTFDRIHARGPIELFEGARLAGVRRVVQVSALGVSSDPRTLDVPYQASKLAADEALEGLGRDHPEFEWAVLRPSLIYGPGSQSGVLFATLAGLPAIGLPGRGQQRVQPLHVYELAEAIVRLLEQRAPLGAVLDLGGDVAITYRKMLAQYRLAMGLGDALWLHVPLPLMRLSARLAEWLPQKAFCRDTVRMLERGNVPRDNALPQLLGRTPSSMSQGLSISRPTPWLDVSARLSPLLDGVLRAALAFLWIDTAIVSAMWPEASGALRLFARCGFTGDAGVAMLAISCALNVALGVLTLARPRPLLYALQLGAVVGYTAFAGYFARELTFDHCGPLAKNIPLLALVLLLWCAGKPARVTARAPARSSRERLPIRAGRARWDAVTR